MDEARNEALKQPGPGEGTAEAQLRPITLEEQLRDALARVAELKTSLDERNVLERVLTRRRHIGYGVGAAGCLGLGGLGIYSFDSLHSLIRWPLSSLPPSLFWALIVGHALITMALVFFCYQLIRAAERLMLPYWWVEKHPEAAKAMLGMMDPVSTFTKATEHVADVVGKVTGAAVNAVNSSK
ncbi:hypothetical protein F0U61_53530 [Archangium violaceum]|uniref:hypothetical protein n=1 Tax=Archangium violaceum TaxID=83451 RepID=UPI002B2DB472|nr:hypothetical protein F0U61_53530 [Archangium violaceum]